MSRRQMQFMPRTDQPQQASVRLFSCLRCVFPNAPIIRTLSTRVQFLSHQGRYMRRFSFIVATALLSIALPATGQVGRAGSAQRASTTTAAQVRDAPAPAGHLIATIPTASVVQVDRCDSTWCAIQYRIGDDPSAHQPRTKRTPSALSMSNGFMNRTPRPMQTSGIFTLRCAWEAISCVTTTSPCACALATR